MPFPMPVIVGSPRSGTTLLRFILDAHPDLAIPPETGFLALSQEAAAARDPRRFCRALTNFPEEATAWADFGLDAQVFLARLQGLQPFSVTAGFRLFYRMYAERFGKERWGDKTPLYGRHLRRIQALFPEARFLHVIRDGRDASLSLRQCWFSPGDDMRVLAQFWRKNILETREEAKGVGHYLEVRFEELLLDTEAVVRRVCLFLDLPFDASMLRYHQRTPERLREHLGRYRADGSELVSLAQRRNQQIRVTMPPDPSRAGLWRSTMQAEERVVFEGVAGDLLRSLGYEVLGAGLRK
ncbi:MAG: sulfotransferase [Proteobacteria bacterium]|nr:sulfotransferase [Pseudomonadota bacterium]MBU1595282.1 sulfotransferase [Pseudomonadota bacterium]